MNVSPVFTQLFGLPEGIAGTDSELMQEDFLMLLTTELANQDPLEPVSDREFLSQLAEFTALEQMTNLRSGFQAFGLLQATSLVGKGVEAIGPDGSVVTGEVNEVMFENSVPVLMVDGVPVRLESVFRVYQLDAGSNNG